MRLTGKLAFWLFLLQIIGRIFLWGIKPEWLFVPRALVFIDLPLQFFACAWLYRLTFPGMKSGRRITVLLLCVMILWEVILNVVLPDDNWIIHAETYLLTVCAIFGFICYIPAYILLVRHATGKLS